MPRKFSLLYEAYRASYTQSISSTTRMQHAKALAFVFLTHYTAKGYTIAETSLGPMARNGINFITSEDDGSDIWQNPPHKTATKKGKRKAAPTQAQKDAAVLAEHAFNFNYLATIQWDWIKPEDMALFVVSHSFKLQTRTPVSRSTKLGLTLICSCRPFQRSSPLLGSKYRAPERSTDGSALRRGESS